ncbi:response regulator with CheY-like receiver domain and winged-helix DNA-binding domain [Mycobacteroides abscessus subsp. massiliense]|uniref:response regulator transcription factor n=1 Tax=Mycobacteroides abscessus TaxID=36809 RepID=UPI0009A5D877|nr:response regulator transcription factor [Mycobacteroides abscessus]SKK92264.1 response regulator with CheY-like receiver domain and winged-helix DNA-binding domain [Mycobacteroides abscessus subsp. massiliense]
MPNSTTATASFGVLVIESGTGWADLVTDSIRREGILVSIAGGGASALLAIVVKARPDMIILEAGDRLDDTLATCRTLRSVSHAHIAVLTADCDPSTTLAGLNAGADEVFAEPLRTGEIACRVRTILNHRHPAASSGAALPGQGTVRQFGSLTIDVQRRLVFVSGKQVRLTRMQFDILVALSHRPEGITTRQELLNAVWGPGWRGNPGVIDVHIGHLRRRLGDDPTNPRLVVNIRGVGYHLPGGA